MLHYLLHIVFVDWDVAALLSHIISCIRCVLTNMSTVFCLCLSAVEGGGTPGREGIQDGRPRRLPARGVRPDEAVLDPGLGGAAFLPYVEGEAAAYQSQGAVPVKRRLTGEGEGEEGGETQPSTAVKWEEEEEEEEERDHSTFLLPAQPVACGTAIRRPLPRPQTSTSHPLLPYKDCFPVCVVKLLPDSFLFSQRAAALSSF